MTDRELVSALERLGVQADDPRAVLLLPLVQVAWADGRMQEPERLRILEIARGYKLMHGPPGETVHRWLTEPPTAEQLALGRAVVVALSMRHRGPTADWGPDTLDRVVEQCTDVAQAAGGLLGIAFSMSAAEQRALDEIRRALLAGRAAVEDDLPDAPEGGFEDL